MKPHKKIFEKISLFRWISIGSIFFLLLFQFYFLYNTYESVSRIIKSSVEKSFVSAVREHRDYRMQNVQTNGTGRVEIKFNSSNKNDSDNRSEDEDILDLGKMNVDDAMFKANSYIISKSPLEISKLDSIYFRFLKDENLEFLYDIIIYKKDSVFFRTTRLVNVSNLQQTNRMELDFETDAQAFYKNPMTVILQKMLWFFISSVLLILVIGYALLYQLRIIIRQKRIEKIRRDFTDSMTHELRHPLQGALSMAEAMENPVFTENADRRTNAVQRIKHNLFNLSNLLESIVQKSYSEKLQQVAEWRDNNLKEMLNDLVVNFTILAKKKIVFVTHFEDIAPTYQYDTVHFPNAIKNLIDNAIKYSDESVTITISVEDNDENFTVTVADNGIGILDKELPYIFDKFYRVYGKKRDHGFGLGLSYVKWVADIHSGSVNVESHKGKGSVFSITIPKAK